MKELTPEQKKAITSMNTALKLCAKAKIDLCVMDSSFIYATQSLLKEHPEFGNRYTPVADADQASNKGFLIDDKRVGTFNKSGVKIDGGGW